MINPHLFILRRAWEITEVPFILLMPELQLLDTFSLSSLNTSLSYCWKSPGWWHWTWAKKQVHMCSSISPRSLTTTSVPVTSIGTLHYSIKTSLHSCLFWARSTTWGGVMKERNRVAVGTFWVGTLGEKKVTFGPLRVPGLVWNLKWQRQIQWRKRTQILLNFYVHSSAFTR